MSVFQSFSIDGKPVKTLYLNGKLVKIERKDYLSITSLEPVGGYIVTVEIEKNGNPSEASFEYSTDMKNWSPFQLDTPIALTGGGTIYLRGDNTYLGSSTSDYYRFSIMGRVKASGNLLSLIGFRREVKSNTFVNMFNGCNGLIEAPYISPCYISTNSFRACFKGCTNLTKCQSEIVNLEPEPNGSASGCRQMFMNCTSLAMASKYTKPNSNTVSAYELSEMFSGCSSLRITEDTGSNLVLDMVDEFTSDFERGVYNMFYGTGGTFTSDPQIGHRYYYQKLMTTLKKSGNVSKSYESVRDIGEQNGNSDGMDNI